MLVISFGLSFRWRERERGHLSSSYTNLSRLLFSGKGWVACVFNKNKDYLENYYASKLLIRDITYKHDLSKDLCSWLIESDIYDNFSILMLLVISWM